MVQDPAVLAARQGTWEQYKATLPFVVINGVVWPYVTYSGRRIPVIVFEETLTSTRTGWFPRTGPADTGGSIQLFGWWQKRNYMFRPFTVVNNPTSFRGMGTVLVASNPAVTDITGLNKDTWLDKVGMAGALAAVSAGFGAIASAGAQAIISGAAVSAADVSAAAAVSLAGNAVVTTAQAGFGDANSAEAIKLLKVASGQLAGTDLAATTGGVTVDDDLFSDVSWSDAVQGYDFTDGEPTLFFGDAQNVDFALGAVPSGLPDFTQPQGFSLDADPSNMTFDQFENLNSTPEVQTNMFGVASTDSGDFISGGDAVKVATAAVPLAKAAGASPPANNAGTNGASVKSTGSNDILGTFASVLSSAGKIAGGVASQLTTATQRQYTGQLTPTGGATVAGGVSANMLLIGAGLIGVALVLHLGGSK